MGELLKVPTFRYFCEHSFFVHDDIAANDNAFLCNYTAIATNRLEYLRKIQSTDAKFLPDDARARNYSPLRNAIKNNDLALVQFLFEEVGLDAQDVRVNNYEFLCKAARNGIEVLKYLCNMVSDDVAIFGPLLARLPEYNHLDILHFLCGTLGLSVTPDLVVDACRNNFSAAVAYFHELGVEMPFEDLKSAVKHACQLDAIDVLSVLLNMYGVSLQQALQDNCDLLRCALFVSKKHWVRNTSMFKKAVPELDACSMATAGLLNRQDTVDIQRLLFLHSELGITRQHLNAMLGDTNAAHMVLRNLRHDDARVQVLIATFLQREDIIDHICDFCFFPASVWRSLVSHFHYIPFDFDHIVCITDKYPDEYPIKAREALDTIAYLWSELHIGLACYSEATQECIVRDVWQYKHDYLYAQWFQKDLWMSRLRVTFAVVCVAVILTLLVFFIWLLFIKTSIGVYIVEITFLAIACIFLLGVIVIFSMAFYQCFIGCFQCCGDEYENCFYSRQ